MNAKQVRRLVRDYCATQDAWEAAGHRLAAAAARLAALIDLDTEATGMPPRIMPQFDTAFAELDALKERIAAILPRPER